MKVKPWPILIIAFIHIFAPIFNILWSAHINHISSYDYLEYIYFNKNILENLFWFVLPVIAGVSILKFRKLSYFFILAFTFCFSLLLIREYLSSSHFPLGIFVLAEITNLIVFCYFLHPAVRSVYLNKNLRWWEQKPRYLIEQPVSIKIGSAIHDGVMKNISEGGCFIETKASISKLDRFVMSFEIFQKKFNTEAQAVYIGADGIGTFFIEIHPSQNELSKIIDQLANQGYPLRTPRPKWNESLAEWLKSLSRGQGLIPRPDTKDSVVIQSSPHKNSNENQGAGKGSA